MFWVKCYWHHCPLLWTFLGTDKWQSSRSKLSCYMNVLANSLKGRFSLETWRMTGESHVKLSLNSDSKSAPMIYRRSVWVWNLLLWAGVIWFVTGKNLPRTNTRTRTFSFFSMWTFSVIIYASWILSDILLRPWNAMRFLQWIIKKTEYSCR